MSVFSHSPADDEEVVFHELDLDSLSSAEVSDMDHSDVPDPVDFATAPAARSDSEVEVGHSSLSSFSSEEDSPPVFHIGLKLHLGVDLHIFEDVLNIVTVVVSEHI